MSDVYLLKTKSVYTVYNNEMVLGAMPMMIFIRWNTHTLYTLTRETE
jgi:hypothetical protein